MITLNAQEEFWVREAIQPGALLSAYRGTRVESLAPDLQTLRLAGDPRVFRLGEAAYGFVTYWPDGEQLHDDDAVVIYEQDGEVVAFYGS